MTGRVIAASIRLLGDLRRLASSNGELRTANARLEQRAATHARELREANLIVQNSSTILYRMEASPAFTLTYISPNIAQFGLDPARLVADPDWAAALIAEADLERVVQAMRSLLSGSTEGLSIEYRVRTTRGPDRWVENRCLIVRDELENVVEIEGIVFDVTARKEAQLALRQREAFTRAILDSVSVEIAVLDRDGLIVAVNAQWRRFAALNAAEPGRAVPRTDVGSDYLAVAVDVGGADGEGSAAGAGIRDVLGGRLSEFALDYACHSPQQERWFRMNVTPLGPVGAGVVVTHEDITARRAMEGELRRSNELLSTALETLPCGICVFDAGARLVAWNEEYVRLLDLPDELFQSRPPSLEEVVRSLATRGEYGQCDVEDKVREVVHRVMTVPAHHFERVRPDGSTLEVRGAGMPGGGLIATFTDISARRNAEALAQRSTRLLGDAIETIAEAFVLFGPDGRLTYCNEKYRALFGSLSKLVVAGASFSDLSQISESSGMFVAPDGVDERAGGAVPHDGPTNGVRLRRLVDGRILRSHDRAMRDGHTVRMLVDVTEHLRATEAAEQALQAKGQFLANISHEVRTPMNAVLGLLTLLKRTELTARQRDYVTRTDGAARALLGVLNAVLDFSKFESGAMQLDLHPFEMETVLRELSLIVSANVGTKSLDVRFDIDPALPHILLGDSVRLQQVLVNLLGNAIKFTDAGIVELAMRVVERSDDSVMLKVQVSDTGIGIAPENHLRIFKGFTQAEASITRRFGGTGLGLAICSRLVDLMGGALTVESGVGAGSRFGFAIRLEAPVAAREHATPGRRAPLRALLVSDDMPAGEAAARMARSLGWAIEPCTDGLDSLHVQHAAHSALACDLALIDYPLTGSIGRALRAHVGARIFPATLPLLMMGSLDDRERLWERDPADLRARELFVVKPFTARMMEEAADFLLGAPAARQAGVVDLRRLSGMRLLVVEDNPTNQLVARELLEAEGADVVVAGDGERALEALWRSDIAFDAVLMDLQMPVMDGFTATRRIRAEQAHAGLPIVAMTANTSPTDRQECLAAGMNAHVGKPFDLNELVVLLRQLAGLSGEASPVAARLDPGPAAAAALARRQGVALGEALARLNGNTRLYVELLSSFVARMPDAIAELNLTRQEGQRPQASRLLHAIKGLAGTLGLARIALEAARAEAASLEEVDASSFSEAIAGFCALLRDARLGLAQLLACLQGGARAVPSDASADLAEVVPELLLILELIRGSDMACIAAVADLEQRVGAAQEGDFALLVESVNFLRFEEAVDLCAGLIARLTQRRG